MKRVSDIHARPVEWLWERRFPLGMISVVAGRPAQGKSLFTNYLIAEVSQTRHVLLFDYENAPREMIRPRLEAIGSRLDHVHHDDNLKLPTDLPVLRQHIADKHAQLVVLDPFGAHLFGVKRFSDSVRLVLDPLKEIVEEHRCAVIIVEHAIKHVSRTADPLMAIGGSSSGLGGAARQAFVTGFQDGEDGQRHLVLAGIKPGPREMPPAYEFELDTVPLALEGDEDVPLLKPVGERVFRAIDLLVTPKDGKEKRRGTAVSDAAEWLTRYLYLAPEHEMPSNDAHQDADAQGFSRITLRRAREHLGIEPFKRERRTWWKLPDALIEQLDEEDGDA